MRIALFGPSLFRLAVGLRSNPTNSVVWYVDKNSFILQRELRDEPLINDRDFCRIDHWYSKDALIFPSNSKIVNELRKFDVVLTADLGALFGPYLDKPYIFLPAGGDLTSAPFPIRSSAIRKSGIAGTRNIKDLLLASVIGPQMRTGIKSATSIWLWSGPFKPWLLALDRLGIRAPTESECLPAAIDTEIFMPKLSKDNPSKELTIFFPSRIMSSTSNFLKETGQWKQNDIFIKGVAEASQAGVKINLLLIKHSISPDEENINELLHDLNISEITQWVQPDNEMGFSWRQLAKIYQESDIVADDFGAGWFGTVALEAAACGKPVFNRVDEIAMNALYKDGHPFLTHDKPDTIAKALIELQDKNVRKEKGIASQKWAFKHHDSDEVARRCQKMLENLLAKLDCKKPQNLKAEKNSFQDTEKDN